MRDFIIVGAGLFGRVIGNALKRKGFTVRLYDNQMFNSGSGPAACLMKPSWLNSFSSNELKQALSLLDNMYGLDYITFKVGLPSRAVVHWCDPKKILTSLESHVRNSEVTNVLPRKVQLDYLKWETARISVIVAAGYWTDELVSNPNHKTSSLIGSNKWIQGQAGVSFFWENEELDPFIKVWSPYKQLVAFNMHGGVWCGDGTSIKLNNWNEETTISCLQRCSRETGLNPEKAIIKFGIRPYIPRVKPCYLKFDDGVIVATGGAKNGTIAAAWCARRILEKFK